MMDVFRKIDGVETVVCRLSEKNAKLSRECMGRDEVTVQVTVDEVLPVQEMDYIRVDGGVYTLNRMTDYDEVSEVEYRYNLMFEGVIYNLMDKMYVNTPTNSDKFYLTATLAEFTALLAENMNTVDAGWSVGDVPETDRKNLQFESVSCREALNRLAGEFGVEFYLEERRICFTERIEHHTSLVFERGKGKGLYKVTCKNADSGNTVTRVRVYGSGDNLPIGYRGGQVDRLQLPMEGGKPVYYLEDFSEFKKVVEKTVHFDDVKPSFTGVVAQVGGDYNRQFTCPEIDFDLNGVAVGDSARVNFLTGDLTGVSFAFQWDNARKEMNLVRQEDSMALPDADGKRVLIPHEQKKAKAGDRFNFTGISLPQAYVDRAEGDLLAKGREWLSFYKQLRVNFGLDVDYRYLREKGYALNVGDVVTVKIPKLQMEKRLRVLSVEKDLNTGRVSCNVSNYITESWEKRIEGQIQSTQSNIDRVNLSVNYLVEASKEWVARHFSRLVGGNRFTGKQVIDGDVELEADRRLNLGGVVLARVADVFRTVLSVSDKDGGEVEVSAAGVRTKRVTTEEVSTPGFVSGLLGEGTRLKDNHLELDEITVRRRMNVHELMIEKVRSVGGSLILSPGAAKIAGVTESGDVFRCTFDNDGGAVENPFEVGDQVYCQAFNGGGIKRYWRLVVAVGTGYFDLSRTDCEAGSATPEAGDEVVLLGNRTDATRQNALLLCAVGADAPYVDQYAGINGFSLAGKLITREGNLSGIVDEALGQLSGSGLYAKNVYLRGKLALSSGKTVETVLGEVDAKADNAQSTGESAQQTASNAAAEVAKAKTELTNVTSDVKLLADAQKGFSVTVTEVREKAEAAQSAVDNLQIGGVNLVDNSKEIYLEAKDSHFNFAYIARIKPNTEYVLSIGSIVLNKGNTSVVRMLVNDFTINFVHNDNYFNISDDIQFFKFTTPDFPNSNVVGVLLYSGNAGATGGISVTYNNVMLEEGNTATGWKQSPADVQKEIDLAQTAANEAKARLTAMSNDGVISKEEKAALRNDKAQIDREFDKYKEDATTYSVSITALLTAYNALVGFLATTVKIADNTDCTFGAGEKDMYNYRFAAYYSARSAFANLIAAKVAATAVDGIQVGGVNLFDNTQNPDITNTQIWDYNSGANVWGGVEKFTAIYISNQWGRLWQNKVPFKAGKVYTFSFYAKRDTTRETSQTYMNLYKGGPNIKFLKATINGTVLNSTGTAGVFGIPLSPDNFQYVTCTFSPLVDVDGSYFRVEFYTEAYQTNRPCGVVYGYKMEEGSMPTAWSPSVADVQKKIDLAQTAANEAKQKLSDWGSDSMISPVEKTALKQQLANIQSEYFEIEQSATRLNMKSVRSWLDYDTAYNLAVRAINKYTATSPESIRVESDYVNITDYFNFRKAILNNVASTQSDGRMVRIIDATGLNQNKYYPVVIALNSNGRVILKLNARLHSSGIPGWAVHPSGFSCECSWEENASGWGTIGIDRYIHSFTYAWTKDTITPIGDIGQMGNSSTGYVYVRGGGLYTVTATNVSAIELKTSAFSISGEMVDIKDSVTPLETVKTELEASIETKASSNELKVVEKNYNALGERVSGAESKITQTACNISLLVKDDSSEAGMVIKPDKIEISGATVFRNNDNVKFSIFGGGGYALNMGGKFKVKLDGTLECTGGVFQGKISCQEGSFGNLKIEGDKFTSNSGMIEFLSPASGYTRINKNGTNIEINNSGGNCLYLTGFNGTTSTSCLKIIMNGVGGNAISSHGNHYFGARANEKITFDLAVNATRGKFILRGLTKVSDTNGWDRMLVNLSTWEVAYG